MINLRRVLSTLFSFEFLLVLSLTAPAYSGHPILVATPLPVGLLIFAASLVTGLFLIIRSKLYVRSFTFPVAFLPLVGWLILSKIWSPSDLYGMDKVVQFSVLVSWPVLATAVLIAPAPERVRRLLLALAMVGVIVAVEAVRIWLTEDVLSIHIGDSNYLAIGRVVGAAAIVTVVILLFDRGVGRWKSLVAAVFLVFVLMITGGRGALVALLLALLMAFLIGFRSTRTGFGFERYQLIFLSLLLLLTATLTFWVLASSEMPRTLERMTYLLEREGGGASAAQRISHISNALRLWGEAPMLGHGIGSYPILSRVGDVRYYPHNMVLELLVEAGLIGLALFGLMIVAAVRPLRLRVIRRDPLLLCVLMLIVQGAVNAMLSLDLPGNQMLFVWLALATLGHYARQAPERPCVEARHVAATSGTNRTPAGSSTSGSRKWLPEP